MNIKIALLFLAFVGFSNGSNAQFDGFSHEIGIIAGPVAFQSDFGQRSDFSTNLGNTGIGIGIIHYLNFTYDFNYNYTRNSFFNDHFKLRSELSYNKTNLKHFGKWVSSNSNSIATQQLRALEGVTTLTNLGMQLEFYPRNIRDLARSIGSFEPFVSLGGQYSSYNSEVVSSLGSLPSSMNKWPKYTDPSNGRPNGFSTESKTVWSVVSSVGTRYKLNDFSDLMVDLRMQYFYSDWIDGLNPNPEIYTENKANDWLVWFNVGFIYYL